ncbi:Pycsar system effector family protein [Microbacterium sulfonylureivorans]|uniref:Pycsar system effector family protein n=1 Tax=Microbacterium sulfonylureivorans TaxID=2486854 RepID=UPI000FDA0721|nr:Pycsar system effector family protein [Microbacterium sulfonylureivorans]
MADANDEVTDAAADALASTMLGEVTAEIAHADEKASLLIGSLGIAFSIVLSGLLGGDWTTETLSTVGLALWVGGALAAILSVVSASLAVWPRLSKAPAGGVITFWGHVQGYPSHRSLMSAMGEHAIPEPERTYQQLFVLSAVVQRKYRCIRWSMVLAGVAAVLVAIAFLFVA